MIILQGTEFDSYHKNAFFQEDDQEVNAAVREIIASVRKEGDAALRRFASRFDKSSPEKIETAFPVLAQEKEKLLRRDPELVSALDLAAHNIKRFALKQREQFSDFECEIAPGLTAGQRVIPVEKAAIYVPAGRFPLISTVLMGLIPAFCAGVREIFLASPPLENGLPDPAILAAAAIALETASDVCPAGIASGAHRLRIFAMGGAQAIAALALGTETVPRVDLIAGPGNKYVAAAKRLLFGETGIDFIAGPTDVLIIAGDSSHEAHNADLIAADMIAQAEHDPDARSRALVPNRELAERIARALEKRLAGLSDAQTARASLDAGGLIIVYNSRAEAVRIANTIAPEHLELHTADSERWIPELKNYGSLFSGELAAEVLGDYSAGINHTLPTSGSARFTGGLSVRHFLKTVTTLRCEAGEGFEKARKAAEIIAGAEGLAGHAASAAARSSLA